MLPTTMSSTLLSGFFQNSVTEQENQNGLSTMWIRPYYRITLYAIYPFCTFSTESKPSTLTSIRDVDDILMVAGLNVGYRVYILMISLEEILFNVGAWMTAGNLCKEIRNFGDRNGPICHQHLCTAICRQHLCSWILMTHFYDLSLFNPSLLPRLSFTTTLTVF